MTSQATSQDGASLAAAVRSLAGEMHRLVVSRRPRDGEILAVEAHVGQLRDQLRHLPPSVLHRWLDGIEREVEGLRARNAVCPRLNSGPRSL